jgi:Zn-dependent peptidase ImmA (M78 family)
MAVEDRVILKNMPTSIRGYVFKDDDGAPVIVLNSRLSREQNRRTYEHERQHIERGEMDEPTYNEYGGK